jgi:lysophospholipase L1-like esterase
MIDCMIVGDSIAVGTSYARPECVSYAKGGWNSWQWNKDYLSKASEKPAKTLIISLGANDHKGVKTEAELRKMRSTVKADRVFWISLGKDRKQEQMAVVTKIAAEYGDTIIPRPEANMSPDKIHPTGKGYKIIGEATK